MTECISKNALVCSAGTLFEKRVGESQGFQALGQALQGQQSLAKSPVSKVEEVKVTAITVLNDRSPKDVSSHFHCVSVIS